ncbi:SapC protein [Fontimonas thermophila]|uniref:SapC protein n=1 Tax=Fontimonas thermophila TaxID=1076937 RepID=A0A1I2I9A0_9GAMM|nr:SapC family protein [Fontimonas thermophila]SFF37707.1 SapC protein [Fontimonas thermophila]
MSRSLRLGAPPGYGGVVPFDRRRHAGMGLVPGIAYTWCATLNAVYVSAAEFARAALDYPLAFAREPGGEYQPVAVLGLRSGENLFVDTKGHWRSGAYVPAYCRRYPFCIAEIPGETRVSGARRLICVDERALTRDTAQPLFDADGNPTPAWSPIQQLIETFEGARLQTRVLARRLEALNLLVPFDALALPRQGPHRRLQGLFRVDEQRLQQIAGRDLRTLMHKGELRAVYAHLISLENFGRLLDLATARH